MRKIQGTTLFIYYNNYYVYKGYRNKAMFDIESNKKKNNRIDYREF